MNPLNIEDVISYVEENIGEFHERRIGSLDNLKLLAVIKRKNPYMFKAKNMTSADQIVRGFVDAYISSNEETFFGEWLEKLAIFIAKKVHNAYKSGISGIDLEFDKDGERYIISVKSGPNWGNAAQIKKMKSDFASAKRTLRTSDSRISVVAINGCCYGKDNKPDKGDYYKLCGQEFWELISGNGNLFTEIVEPLGYKAKEKNDEFIESYEPMINKFTKEFLGDFCDNDGKIDWEKLVRFNSEKKQPKQSKHKIKKNT